MGLEEELKTRKWPERPVKRVAGFDASVRTGRMYTRALRLRQCLSEPIPPEECAITSLCAGKDGRIFGATSGRASHLFMYNPMPRLDQVTDLGILPGATSVSRSLVAGTDGTIYGGISAGTEGSGYLFCFTPPPPPDDILFYLYNKAEQGGDIQRLCEPVPGEHIACLAMDRKRNILYGLGTHGTLFSYNPVTRQAISRGLVAEHGQFSPVIVCDVDGVVYGCGLCGTFWAYDPVGGTVRYLPARIPSVAGRAYYNELQSAVWSPADGLIYGGGSADGVVFSYNPKTGSVRSLGKVTASPGCPAIAALPDGRIFGINGEKDGMAHLFCFDPQTGSLDDLGIPATSSEISWFGYEFGSMCVGSCGELYLGETDRISHLFIYFPPPREASQPQQ